MRYLFMSDVRNPRVRGWGSLALQTGYSIYCRQGGHTVVATQFLNLSVAKYSVSVSMIHYHNMYLFNRIKCCFADFNEATVHVSLENYQLNKSKDRDEYFRGTVTPQQKQTSHVKHTPII